MNDFFCTQNYYNFIQANKNTFFLLMGLIYIMSLSFFYCLYMG